MLELAALVFDLGGAVGALRNVNSRDVVLLQLLIYDVGFQGLQGLEPPLLTGQPRLVDTGLRVSQGVDRSLPGVAGSLNFVEEAEVLLPLLIGEVVDYILAVLR